MALNLPEPDIARIKRFVDERNERIAPEARDKIRYEVDIAPGSVTILDCRPPWREGYGTAWTPFPIARLRYVKARKEWGPYWRDRNLKFHIYDRVAPTPNVQTLLDEVTSDPTYIFWADLAPSVCSLAGQSPSSPQLCGRSPWSIDVNNSRLCCRTSETRSPVS